MGRCKSRVWPFVTPWTVARQAPLSMKILQARILVWAAMPSSRDRTWVSCIAGGLFTDWATRKPLLGHCSPGEPASWLHRTISIIQQRTFVLHHPDTDAMVGECIISTVQSHCHEDLKWGTSLTAWLHNIVYLISKGWYTPKAWGLADPEGVASNPRGSLFLCLLSPPLSLP